MLPKIGTHTLLRISELHESCHVVTFYNSVKFVAFIAFALIENVVTSIDNNSQGALCNLCKSIRIILYIIREADYLFSTHHGKTAKLQTATTTPFLYFPGKDVRKRSTLREFPEKLHVPLPK